LSGGFFVVIASSTLNPDIKYADNNGRIAVIKANSYNKTLWAKNDLLELSLLC
jgi:acetyl-CoA carboxylase carboxyltransferase component